MEKLSDLPNIGPEVERQLMKAGIQTYDDLKSVGSKEAWLKIFSFDSSACINRLYAIEGAILGIKKVFLPAETKAQLKEFYNAVKKGN